MEITISHTKQKDRHSYFIVGNDNFVGYEPILKDNNLGFPPRSRLVYRKEGNKKEIIFNTSSTFCQNFFGLPQVIYKAGQKVGYAKLLSREFFISIDNYVYEISYHKKKIFSIMKNDKQFAVGQYFDNKPYKINYDDSIENDYATLLFLAMYSERIFRIVTRSQVNSFGDLEIWFDYKEERTKWLPPAHNHTEG